MSVAVFGTYGFEAAHFLPRVPEGHKCRRMHGHSYKLDVSVSGELDSRGFVLDYAELDGAVQPFVDSLDHRILNEIAGLENPTSENLALWFKDRIGAALNQVPTVRVYETPRHWVEA